MSNRTDPACNAKTHGTYSSYRQGCVCLEAREDNRIYRKRIRENRHTPRLIDATGTRRRIQALLVMGWSRVDLAKQMGITDRAISYMLSSGSVLVRTARKVDEVFKALNMTPGPSQLTRTLSIRRGWVSGLAWDDIDDPNARPAGAVRGSGFDEVLVERAVNGERGDERLGRADAQEAIRRCRARGMPVSEITWRVGVSDRTVHRQGGTAPASAA